MLDNLQNPEASDAALLNCAGVAVTSVSDRAAKAPDSLKTRSHLLNLVTY